ncbi:hypothetical protein ABMB67_003533 [Halalkalibacter oceani]
MKDNSCRLDIVYTIQAERRVSMIQSDIHFNSNQTDQYIRTSFTKESLVLVHQYYKPYLQLRSFCPSFLNGFITSLHRTSYFIVYSVPST